VTLRALVFDFDGLILDTEWPEYLAVAEAYEAHGLRMEIAEWRARVGTVGPGWMDELEERLGSVLDRAEVGSVRRLRRRELIAEASPLPGIVDLVEAAHAAGLRLGVASSARTAWLDEHLGRLGLHARFDVLIGRDVVGDRAKPAPDVYLAALDVLGVASTEAVALEDSSPGIAAATAAGLAVVAIPNRITVGGDLSAADLVVESAAVLTLDVLRSLLVA
jgi:HAD superfamily hydrolase (TIGR01509 family)